MKKFLLLLLLGLTSAAYAQNSGGGEVTKSTSGATKNNIDEDLNFAIGRTLRFKTGSVFQFDSGASITGAADFRTALGLAPVAASGSAADLTGALANARLDSDLQTFAGITPSANVITLLNAADFSAFKTSLSLANVTNTSDANKPVSTAQQTALDLKLAKASNLSDVASVATALDNIAQSNDRIFEIKHWWNALYAGKATMWVMGDSVGAFKPAPQYLKLFRAYGFGGYIGHNYSLTGVEVYTGGAAYYSGAVSSGDPSFVIWPTGQYYTLPSGGTITRPNTSILAPNGWTASKLKVIYNAEAGAGVFKVQIIKPGGDWADAPGASSVDATVGTGNKVLSITLPSADAWSYRLVGISGGTTKICESGLVNTTGICIIEIWRGSLPLTYMNTWASANAATVFADADITPNLITQELKDYWTDTAPIDAFEALLTAAGVSASTDVCYIGSTPDQSTNAQLIVQNTIALERARYFGRAYWDGYTMAETYAKVQQAFNSTLGDIHLNAAAQSFFSDQWARDLRLFGFATPTEQPTRAGVIAASTALTVQGKDVFTALEKAIGAAKAGRGEINLTGAANNYLTGTAPSIGTSDFTWCGWVYLPRLGEAGAMTNAGLFTFSSSASTSAVANAFCADYDPSGDEMRLTLSNSTGLRRMRCSSFLATYGGGWRLVTVRRSSGLILFNIGRAWVGSNYGSQSATFTETTLGTTSPPAWTDTITSTNQLVGRSQQNGVFRYSEVAVYTRALTNAEVFEYSDSGVAPATANALYLFNERAGTTSYDASGGGRHLTHSTTGLWFNANRLVSSSSLRTGTATLVAGTVTVSDSSTGATTRIRLHMLTPGGTVGAQYVSAKVNSTSFTITSTSASDTSVIYYEAFEP